MTYPHIVDRTIYNLVKLFNPTSSTKAVVELIPQDENPLDRKAILIAALVDIYSGNHESGSGREPITSDYLIDLMEERGLVRLVRYKGMLARPMLTEHGLETLHASLYEMEPVSKMEVIEDWDTPVYFNSSPQHRLDLSEKELRDGLDYSLDDLPEPKF